ncbi:MAG: hypothetical protein IIB77_10285 [Proteobacteria bacterium]|nr:hypothetical protein [Pseudomonadota bacterium]
MPDAGSKLVAAGRIDVASSPGGVEKSTDKKTPTKAFMPKLVLVSALLV